MTTILVILSFQIISLRRLCIVQYRIHLYTSCSALVKKELMELFNKNASFFSLVILYNTFLRTLQHFSIRNLYNFLIEVHPIEYILCIFQHFVIRDAYSCLIKTHSASHQSDFKKGFPLLMNSLPSSLPFYQNINNFDWPNASLPIFSFRLNLNICGVLWLILLEKEDTTY